MPKQPGRLVGIVGLLLGVCILAAPFFAGHLAYRFIGTLILAFGLLQNWSGFALGDSRVAGSWFSRGGGSIVTGLLLLLTPRLTFAGLAVLLGLSWIISGASTIVAALRRSHQADRIWTIIDGSVNVLFGLAIAAQWPISGLVSIAVYVGLKCLSAGWSLIAGASPQGVLKSAASSDQHPDERLDLPAHPYIGQLRAQLASEEVVRRGTDRHWVWIFVLTLFAIHASRMHVDWNVVGLMSPAGAVIGDMIFAVVLAYAFAAPISVLWHRATRGIERRTWNWYLARVDRGATTGLRCRIAHWWLVRRMRTAERRSESRGSFTGGLGWGLRTGLPAAALLVALTPLWGVNWFFDTESWVTGAWEMWADQRTDTWREHMVRAVRQEYGADANDPEFHRIKPEGLEGAKDFSFIVIGDTGEGDASQHILRDQLLLVGQKPEVKFLIVSSDVIYPAGAMNDYEPKFYLPFKGFHKPIYALPGNHDWYDALEAFNANFLEPRAARASLLARREVDHKLTTTTEARIDDMIAEADRFRTEYQLKVARQRSPYFEILTDEFSLVVVDTGILRRIDDDQMTWLTSALERGQGRFQMAILGHPLYVANRYQGEADPDFARIGDLLKKHGVSVVMAGDTHDFEFYNVPETDTGDSTYHFVNGGGGAYLSIGTALDWPKTAVVPQCGCYPRPDALNALLETYTPLWKRPLWLWCKYFGAWPSSREIVGAAFDYNRAPFFQSFMEVRVEGSSNSVRYWLYGCNGRLRWRDIYVQGGNIPQGQSANDFVEFVLPLRRRTTDR